MKLYKGRYFFAFYDITDEKILHIFDNINEILIYQQKEVNRKNINNLVINLNRALRRKGNLTALLNNEIMRVYLIDIKDE